MTFLLALKYPGTVGQLITESQDFSDINCLVTLEKDSESKQINHSLV